MLLSTASCGDSSTQADADYDGDTCERLATMVEARDSLSQQDYAQMIEQNEQILKYLVARNRELEDLPEERRYDAYRELQADPEYMERFGYLFTLGSALYKASADSVLDDANTAAYAALDEYNTAFSEISDRF